MAYHTAGYLFVFLPLALILYQAVPRKGRWAVLLVASWVFYWFFSGKLLLVLIGTSLFTHYICRWISLLGDRKKTAGTGKPSLAGRILTAKTVLAFGTVTLLGILIYLKYYNFFVVNWNAVADSIAGMPVLQAKTLILPLGISFYTLRAIGYMADVYWKKAEVPANPAKTALFLGFFPQIMEGPFSSYEQTADALWKGDPIRFEALSAGCVRIMWGLFKKLLIADRLDVPVGMIFGQYHKYHGAVILLGAIFYTIQLYMEFSGCIDIVNGSAQVFGISLPENFRQPFFAQDAADFWRRWHITLGVWLRTYVFYPVSVSGPVKKWNRFAKKHFGRYVAKTGTLALCLFPVWLCNGFWHGPKWSYIFYGMYYFAVLFLTAVFDPVRDAVLKRLHIRKEAVLYKAVRVMKTWIIIFTGELFFRAEGLSLGIPMFFKIFRDFSLRHLTGGILLGLGLDQADYLVAALGCLIVFAVDIAKEKGISVEERIGRLPTPLRWGIYYGLIFSIIILGAYGVGYQAVDLIYAGF